MTTVEIEFKNLLTKPEYERLLKHFAVDQKAIRTQTNIYFDTPTLALKQQQKALRIRITNETQALTLKAKSKQGHLEIEQMIDKQHLNGFIQGPVYDALIALGVDISSLKSIAKLTTKRAHFPYEAGTLFLDESFYGDQVDYEVEYEALDYQEGLAVFQKFLADHQIPIRHAEPKIARALS